MKMRTYSGNSQFPIQRFPFSCRPPFHQTCTESIDETLEHPWVSKPFEELQRRLLRRFNHDWAFQSCQHWFADAPRLVIEEVKVLEIPWKCGRLLL